MQIRIAQETDLRHIVHIYNQAVAMKNATADLSSVTVAGRHGWFREHTAEKYPIWVAVTGKTVVGWCCLSPYRAGRMALRHTAEISYYVHEGHRRQGVASILLMHAFGQCRELDIKTLFALLLDINTPSVAILLKFGFKKWGHMPNVADIDGKECGHLIYGKRVINPHSQQRADSGPLR